MTGVVQRRSFCSRLSCCWEPSTCSYLAEAEGAVDVIQSERRHGLSRNERWSHWAYLGAVILAGLASVDGALRGKPLSVVVLIGATASVIFIAVKLVRGRDCAR